MFIRFVTTGGTIDKIYFDDLSQFEVGESQVQHILHEGLVDFDYEVEPLLHKDSLEMTDEDKQAAGISPGLVRIAVGYTGSLEQRRQQLRTRCTTVALASLRRCVGSAGLPPQVLE